MSNTPSFPSFDQLFGDLDFKKGDEGRSVYSPAAYLADLLQLLEDHFGRTIPNENLFRRRTDIEKIPLNGENAFTTLPYLDIVNNILEAKIRSLDGVSPNHLSYPYDRLRAEKYPLQLPFNLENERFKKYYSFFNANVENLYKYFSTQQPDPLLAAKEYLGLSEEEYQTITAEATSGHSFLRQHFNLSGTIAEAHNTLKSVSQFLRLTGISGKDLRELLFQNLSRTAFSQNTQAELEQAAFFFINHDTNGFANLHTEAEGTGGDTEEEINWGPLPGNSNQQLLDSVWFKRISRTSRFLRLAQKTQIKFADLDLILRTCCQNLLDANAIQIIAAIKKISAQYDVAIDVVCSLISDISILGIGDEKHPTDLFNRIFNTDFTSFDKRFMRQSAYLPAEYTDTEKYGKLPAQDLSNILSEANTDYRKRIQAALYISEKDFNYIINSYRIKHLQEELPSSLLDEDQVTDLSALSLLFRISKLVEWMDISYRDFFDLLHAMDYDPTIRIMLTGQGDVPSHTDTAPFGSSVFQVLMGNDHKASEAEQKKLLQTSLSLVQELLALGQWMQNSDMTGAEIRSILTGTTLPKASLKLLQGRTLSAAALEQELQEISEKETSASEEQQISGFNQVYQQCKKHFFKEDYFISDRFDLRSSGVLHRSILQEGRVVSSKDQRILHFDKKRAEASAAQAISQLNRFSKEDFLDLGIEDKMIGKILNNLIIKGYIDPDGLIIEEKFPTSLDAFSINYTSTDEQKELFYLIHDLFEAEDVEDDPSAVEFSVYPSDLEDLDSSEMRKKELYDNLVFNGYINEQGLVLQSAFFAEVDNYEAFDINANIASYSPLLYNIIEENKARFERQPLKLNKEIFTMLPLKAIEVEDLLENLQFNGYIDEEGNYLNKEAILLTEVGDFLLANPFLYRHGAEILRAIQTQVQELKNQFYTLNEETIRPVAKQIVADRVYRVLEHAYLTEQEFPEEKKAFFLEPDNVSSFSLDSYFDDNLKAIVFKAIATFIKSAEKYRLSPLDLEDLQLAPSDTAELLALLQTQRYLDDQWAIHPDQVAFFLNGKNVQVFDLGAFKDFAPDLFARMQAIAVEWSAASLEIVEGLQTLASKQEQALFDNLQEYLELPAGLIKVIAEHVMGMPGNIIETLLSPISTIANQDDFIDRLPNDKLFNIAINRIRQFSELALKLQLTAEDIDVVFRDQDLVEKYPENLQLPTELLHFDALMEGTDGLIYVFGRNLEGENLYWTYSSETYELDNSEVQPRSLSNLSPKLAGAPPVDAAFVDPHGNSWIITGAQYFTQTKGREHWKSVEKNWGKIESNFTTPEQIDAAFVDYEGKTYLFSGNQYIRYSNGYGLSVSNTPASVPVDEGYPKQIRGNWRNELLFDLPEQYEALIEAAFQSPNGKTYIFREGFYVCSDNYMEEQEIGHKWGKIDNNFTRELGIDAALNDGSSVYFFSGNQVLQYFDCIENEGVLGTEGTLMKIANLIGDGQDNHLPAPFENQISAAFKGFDDKIHLFSQDQYIRYSKDFRVKETSGALAKEQWGRVRNTIRINGQVDAALSGQDGRTYLFSGDQYFRYSRADYALVDEGFPRLIAKDWVGIETINAAFILDGKTYLFGTNQEQEAIYIRYSSMDYTEPDKGYPKKLSQEEPFWNFTGAEQLSEAEKEAFSAPDAVFIGMDDQTYLFKGNQFISSDHNQRWWTKPQPLAERWDSLPFESVAAAFTGKNGITYIFEGPQLMEEEDHNEEGFILGGRSVEEGQQLRFVRYTDKNYTKIDHRSPSNISDSWGKIVNHIERTGRIDAAITLVSKPIKIDEEGKEIQLPEENHTYLFSGDQYFRYTGDQYHEVDEGYPRFIQSNLMEEPRFTNLLGHFDAGIDAAFADQRTVYLFKDGQLEAISETEDRVYNDFLPQQIKCAFIENGQIFIEVQEAEDTEPMWRKYNALEARESFSQVQLPTVLREVPDTFQKELHAVLLGTDQHQYLFKGQQCYNVLLKLSYPIKEEWGRVRNNIHIDNKIDAAFVDTNHNTYLFSGDQFVVYRPDSDQLGSIPNFIDQYPMSIREHWHGLENVRLAFVKDGKTYLVEQWDADGNFRYICFSGTDYSRPEQSYSKEQEEHSHHSMGKVYSSNGHSKATPNYINTANFETWEVLSIPKTYYDEGFNRVQAVLQQDEHLFLISQDAFIHYNYEEDVWTYPRALDRKWDTIALNIPDLLQFNPDLSHIRTAFIGPDEKTYFFSDEAFLFYDRTKRSFSELREIRSFWGFVDNNIQKNGHIDAAFVMDGRTTYLLSGDQYVRYSTTDYRYIDEGYPKTIVDDLRQEEGFQNLPDHFEDRMEILLEQGHTIDAVLTNERNVYLFEQNNCHVFSRTLSKAYKTERIGHLKNNIADDKQIDAVFLNNEQHTILLSGDQIFKYSQAYYDFEAESYVEEGYPKSISEHLVLESGFENLPPAFYFDIDASFNGVDGHIYLFKDQQFYSTGNPGSGAQLITDFWGKTTNVFNSNTPDRNIGIDAMFIAPDGQTYVFKNDQYARYGAFDEEYIDEGFPKPIKDNWGNLPTEFEQGIDAAFTFEGKTYFLKGNQYVRYNEGSYQQIGSIYPQLIQNRWQLWNDYLLHDLMVMSRYAQLRDQYQGSDYSLTQFFYAGHGYNKLPYQMLADIFDWDVEEVKWLKRRNVFLQEGYQMEARFTLEQVLKMYDTFQLTSKIGAAPSDLYENVWQNRFVQAVDPELSQNARRDALRDAADALYRYHGMNNSSKDWDILASQLHDEMNLLKRDALMPYVISKIDHIDNPRELLNHLLIDVEMGSEAETSYIKEAISAVQLYLHRYFVNLESPDVSMLQPERREELKQWWKWMKNYRVWEANRKVFLYPENYIRPELRDTKTPEFQKLEEALLQGELNQELAEKGFKDYLDAFGTLGNLKITGANIYNEGTDQVLILFGHTRTEPKQYYYRTAKFSNGLVDWKPWEIVDTAINADRVFPVYAFGRLLVFWIEIEEYEESEAKFLIREDENAADVNTSRKKLKHRANIKYAFYNYNKKWGSPQVLKNRIKLNYEIDAAYVEEDKTVVFVGGYCLKTSNNDPGGDVKSIQEYPEFEQLPSEFANGIDAATIFKGHRYLFKGNRCFRQRISDGHTDILRFKDLFVLPKDKFLAVVKGPFGTAISIEVDINEVQAGVLHLHTLGKKINITNPVPPNGFDAGFALNNDVLCLIDKAGNYFFYNESGGKLRPVKDLQTVSSQIGHFQLMMSTLANKSGQFAPADAVFKKKDKETNQDILYVLRDGEYEAYSSKGMELIPFDGFPKPIKGNLNFNMDKFFNKLHVVWDGIEDGNVSLTYYHPKNQLLLSGRLLADLTFEEAPIEDDKAVHSILQWDKFNEANLRTYPDSTFENAALTAIQNWQQGIQERLAWLNNLSSIVSQSNTFVSTTAQVDTLLSQASDDDKATAKSNFDSSTSAIRQALSTLKQDNRGSIKNMAETLDTAVENLQQGVASFLAANDDNRDQRRNTLVGLNNTSRNMGNTMNAGVGRETRAIRADIRSFRTDFEEQDAGLKAIQQNIQDHKAIIADFNGFVRSSESDLSTWGREAGMDFLDDVPALPLGRGQLNDYQSFNQDILDQVQNAMNAAIQAGNTNAISTIRTNLQRSTDAMGNAANQFPNRNRAKDNVDDQKESILRQMSTISNTIRERLLGRFDLFQNSFGIKNKTNFTFSEPDWYIFEAEKGTFLCQPIGLNKNGSYRIHRLTTTLNSSFSTRLFEDGLGGLLSLNTQELDEKPGFGPGKEIQYNQSRFAIVPSILGQDIYFDSLDFNGANAIYYWEIFFHAPYLIAQSLNTAQKFEEAQDWHEFIFDPTASTSPWKFLPFTRSAVENNFLLDTNQMDRYLNDPFDPHAIAALRPSAYRKAIVMSYIDNLLDWGDMLFRQYTVESINEARMLYILAYDLLGDKPENLGVRILTEDQSYAQLLDASSEPDFNLLELENAIATTTAIATASNGAPAPAADNRLSPHDTVLKPYFFIPENGLFLDYWNRVEDRLYKIRHSLNILGKKQPLLLFQPPIDPMALVQAVASGAGIGQALAGMNVAVPPYRFSFMLAKARELAQKVNQFGSELLGILEKKDAEALSILQLRQEDEIFAITREIRKAQLEEADYNIKSLKASLENADARIKHYDQLISRGMSPLEIAQITLMAAGALSNFVSSGLKIVSAAVSPAPDVSAGPFITGAKTGGSNIGQGLNTAAEVFQSLGEGLSMTGEAIGIGAQYERMAEDWDIQKAMAESDRKQIEAQISGAEIQRQVAQYEIDLVDKELEHNKAMRNFLQDKFTNQQLYQWMNSRLSGVFYQTYKLAYDMAKYAEKSYQFERGTPRKDINFIQATYWDSLRKGIMAGEQLGLDLDRMEQSYIETDDRRLEISKNISLLEIDPLAFLDFKYKGVCEFSLQESLFDYDFPGHYCRQIKTVALTLDIGEGKYLNASLTQLSHKVVMNPDPKAVKYLLNPRDKMPLSIRSDWKANQQIALSHFDDYEKNNGMFELRFDSELYLPFEGTGAVSTWRLELKGKNGALQVRDLSDLVINVKYTAIDGGEAFADSIKGMLKPYATSRYFDLSLDFQEEWLDFLNSDEEVLRLPMSRSLFPNMSSGKISSIFTRYELEEAGQVRMVLNEDEDLVLKEGKFLDTTGLSISSRGTEWTLEVKGDKQVLRTIYLVVGYKASVK